MSLKPLPQMLVEAGIATKEQAAKLAELIARDDEESWGPRTSPDGEEFHPHIA
jgi:hypothetical protein